MSCDSQLTGYYYYYYYYYVRCVAGVHVIHWQQASDHEPHNHQPREYVMKTIASLVAVLGVLLPLTGTAYASGPHWCRQGDPPILASANTSCPFGGKIIDAWARADQRGYWAGRVYSPVTHRRYWIACSAHGYPSPTMFCQSYGTNIWARFSADL
jgi:hypothetical protein